MKMLACGSSSRITADGDTATRGACNGGHVINSRFANSRRVRP